MKTKEFMFEGKKPRIRMPKQRDPNWQTMQAKSTSGAGGEHKDRKRAEKQGDVKHRKDLIPMENIREDDGVAASPRLQRAHEKERQRRGLPHPDEYLQMIEKKKKEIADMRAQDLEKDVKEEQDPDEGYMDRVISDLHKDARGFRPDQEWGNWWMSLTYKEKVKVFDDMVGELGESVKEASDFGEPKEILADVLDTLEREVEWPLTEVMDYEEVLRLLAPIKNAVNQRLKTMDKGVAEGSGDTHLKRLEYDVRQLLDMGEYDAAKENAALAPTADLRTHLRKIIRRAMTSPKSNERSTLKKNTTPSGLSVKQHAAQQMEDEYGDGNITFHRDPAGGYNVRHIDDAGEIHSHQYDPKTGVIDIRNRVRSTEERMAETTGDKPFDQMMRMIKKGTRKQATADRRERDAASRERARAAFGPSPADKLSIRPDKGVSGGSKIAVDRKTGRYYDPDKELDKLLNQHKTQFQGMAAIEKAQSSAKKAKPKKPDVSEGKYYGYDDSGYSLRPGHDEGEPVYDPRYDLTSSGGVRSSRRSDGQPRGMYFYNVPADKEQQARTMGLRQTKSGKWYSRTSSDQADKEFGKGRYWEPKKINQESQYHLSELGKEPGGMLDRYLAKAGGPEGRQRRIKAAIDDPGKLTRINKGIDRARAEIDKEREKRTGMDAPRSGSRDRETSVSGENIMSQAKRVLDVLQSDRRQFSKPSPYPEVYKSKIKNIDDEIRYVKDLIDGKIDYEDLPYQIKLLFTGIPDWGTYGT